jgi:hypothetical protein
VNGEGRAKRAAAVLASTNQLADLERLEQSPVVRFRDSATQIRESHRRGTVEQRASDGGDREPSVLHPVDAAWVVDPNVR